VKPKVLILGATGMLGSCLDEYLGGISSISVERTSRDASLGKPFDAEVFLEEPEKYSWLRDFDYILNAIGIIKPYCKENDHLGCARAMRINALFPRALAGFVRGTSVKVIQIATDCVFSGKTGSYDELAPHDATDTYGKSKSLGEIITDHMLHIRCSIIGREKKSKLSLLEWFLAQPKGSTVQGYDHHLWNGVTTLQFAQLCERIIVGQHFESLRAESPIHHFIPNETVTKYQLLKLFAEVFEHPVTIQRIQRSSDAVNRTLSTKYSSLTKIFPESEQIEALKAIYR
jgi:dTDP-4-dehydrorhamnose reductase